MRTLFYGTPEIAVPFMELLSQKTQVVAVVSQPDKPAGRSLKIEPTPVKRKALELGLRVLQPNKPSEIAAELKALAPDFALAVAYGRILRADALGAPRLGTLNVHFSLLPAYRGAAPVQWALANGEPKSGVTIFWLDEGMDTGPTFIRKEVEVGPEDDARDLFGKLQGPSLAALGEAIEQIGRGEISKVPQSGAASVAPLIKKEDARLSLSFPATKLHNLVRAFVLWPKAYFETPEGKRLIVLKTRVDAEGGEGRPGAIIRVDGAGPVLVQCPLGSRLWFLSVQPEGKKPVSAADFCNGLRLKAGDVWPVSL